MAGGRENLDDSVRTPSRARGPAASAANSSHSQAEATWTEATRWQVNNAALPTGTDDLRLLSGAGREQAILRLQQTHGNAYVQRALLRHGLIDGAAIRRHPEGAALPDKESLAAELNSAEQQQPAEGDPTARESTGAEVPAEPETQTPAPAEGESRSAATGAAPTTATPGAAEPGPTATPPPVPTVRALSLARAQSILGTSYGSVHRIAPGTIVMLADNAAAWAQYDRTSVGRTNIYVTPRRPWRNGDAQAAFPRGLNGFQDGGTVYVNQGSAVETTTPHEMLHLNTAAGFRSAVGETINEGATQYLTVKALRDASITVPSPLPYAQETSLVTDLVAVVTESTLTQAYFGGASTLITAFDNARGAGRFSAFKALAEARDFTAASASLRPSPEPTVAPPSGVTP